MLRECFDSFFQYSRVTSCASKRLSIESTASADSSATICLFLAHLSSADGQSMKKAQAEFYNVTKLQRFASSRFG